MKALTKHTSFTSRPVELSTCCIDHTKHPSSLVLRAPAVEVDADVEVDEGSRLVFISKNEYFHTKSWDEGSRMLGVIVG